MTDPILDVDLLAFEHGNRQARAAVVDGVMRSLATGFVYTSHDIAEETIDEAYDHLATFFSLDHETKRRWVAPGSHGQTGYTDLLVETAASSDTPDWKEMLNWGETVPEGHPLRRKYPHRYMEPVLPEADVPGITGCLMALHRALWDLQRRFLRVIAVGLGADEAWFDAMLVDGPTLSRAIRYPPMHEAPGETHVWAGSHGDINLITALPRATAPGLQVETEDGWIDAVAPPDGVIINTGMMLEHVSNGVIPTGVHRVVADPDHHAERYSVVQFCHPTPWTILDPLSSTITAERPQRFAPIEAGDKLDQVLYDINLVEGGRRVTD
ncbi:MAG: 2-oxoglutarate and iron-dependent oxygenase domain-containing protein [Actinomycetota bacterium]